MLKNISINNEPIMVKRALLSVYDKSNIVELANSLHENNVEIISSGGTASELRSSDIPVVEVNDFTGYPEIMDGRVKTLNPHIAGGILGLRNMHAKEAQENNIKSIGFSFKSRL